MIELLVGQRVFTHFKSFAISASREDISSAFSFTTDYKTYLESGIKEQTPVIIRHEKTIIMAGRVDGFRLFYSAADHRVELFGRSNTSVLVDSHWTGKNQWQQKTARHIIMVLAGKVPVMFLADADNVIENFEIDSSGETRANAIQRVCELSGLSAYDKGGTLVINRDQFESTENNIVTGISKVKEASLSSDGSNRYGLIIVRGQSALQHGKTANQLRAEVRDPLIDNGKVLILMARNATTQQYCDSEANYELTSRIGKALTLSYTLQGFSDKELYEVNQIMLVDDSNINISGRFVVRDISYSSSDSGTVTRMTLHPPEAFKKSPVRPIIKRSKLGTDKQPVQVLASV